jgi:hypothetical protein
LEYRNIRWHFMQRGISALRLWYKRSFEKGAKMSYFGNDEPAIDELIDDPIGRLIISYSGMTPQTVRALMDDVRRKWGGDMAEESANET